MSEHYFQFELKNIGRNINKETWKRISRWLRIARNEVEKELPEEEVQQKIRELGLYGKCVL